jgi:hypothetical protein
MAGFGGVVRNNRPKLVDWSGPSASGWLLRLPFPAPGRVRAPPVVPRLTDAQYNLVSCALNSFGVSLDDFLPGAGPLGWS